MHFFDFFEIPVSLNPDVAALRQAYLRNSRKFHPDFHTLADDAAQAAMLEQASLNNEAFQTLLNPERRMAYVLKLFGLLGDENAAPAIPQDFLMEMMDINEALMELEFDFDQARFDNTLNQVQNLENELDKEVEDVVKNWSGDAPDSQQQLERVRDFFLKKKYLLRIRENLSNFAALKKQ